MITKNVIIRFLQLAIQFVITILIARVLEPEGYGYFSLFIAEVAIVTAIIGLSIESPIMFFVSKNKLSLSLVFNLALFLLFFQFIALLLLFFVAKYVFAYTFFLFNESTSGFIWGFLYVFSLLIYNYCSAYLSGKGEFFLPVFWLIAFQIVLIATIAILYYFEIITSGFFRKTENVIPLFCTIYIIQAIISLFFVSRYVKENIVISNPLRKIPNEFFKYALKVFYINLIQFLSYRVDIWLLDFYKTKADVGQYSLAVKIGQLWWVLPQLLSSLIFPLTALHHTQFSQSSFVKYIKFTLIAGIVTAIIALLIFPFIIDSTIGNAYMPAYYLLLILLPGLILFSVTILLSAKLSGKGNMKINLYTTIICFLIIIPLDFLLIPLYSAMGAAIASSIGYTVSSIYIIAKYSQWRKDKK